MKKHLLFLCSLLLGLTSQTLSASGGSFQLFHFKAKDNQERPYVVYRPSQVQPSEKRPLLIFLHGAISRPQISQNPEDTAKKSPIISLAEKGQFYVLFPYGQKGATWFDDVGSEMVLGEFDAVKKNFPIDEDKVFLSGFSDGGSGTFYFAAAHSTPFAGFIPLNGSLSVAANLGASPLYLENINHKPLLAINTQSDALYPVKMMQPTIDKLRQHHNNVQYKTPEGNHEMSYLPTVEQDILHFIQQYRRQPLQAISLEQAEKPIHIDWLSIEEINPQAAAQAWHTPYSLKMLNDKASFGVSPDIRHQGEGLKVNGFGKNSVAKEMGVQIGDIILKMEDVAMNHRYASFEYLSRKKAGDSTELTLSRDGKTLILKGKFAPAYEYEVFEKQPISAKIEAKLQENGIEVRTSRVKTFAIDFSQLPFKTNETVTLTINGKAQQLQATGRQILSTE